MVRETNFAEGGSDLGGILDRCRVRSRWRARAGVGLQDSPNRSGIGTDVPSSEDALPGFGGPIKTRRVVFKGPEVLVGDLCEFLPPECTGVPFAREL